MQTFLKVFAIWMIFLALLPIILYHLKKH